jgi:hypothetical protein
MITERRPDVSPFSAIEFIANWLSGTLTEKMGRSATFNPGSSAPKVASRGRE